MENGTRKIGGLIRGKAWVFTRTNTICADNKCFDAQEEKETVRCATRNAKTKIQSLLQLEQSQNPILASTLSFYQMMLDDPELETGLFLLIEKEKKTAQQAINSYFDRFVAQMDAKDEYFKNRKFDFEDIRNLMNETFSETILCSPSHPVNCQDRILVMDSLLATDLVRIDFSRFSAVISRKGGKNSHAAIILNSMGIPFAIIPKLPQNVQGEEELVLDFWSHTAQLTKGTVFLMEGQGTHPIPSGNPPTTYPSNTLFPNENVRFFASLNFLDEGLSLDTKYFSGIGMFRTEMKVLSDNNFPSEEEQYSRYLHLVKHLADKPVLFRLWDIEPDKIPACISTEDFGASFLIHFPDLAKKQLRALLKVSQNHPIGMTIPMVKNQLEIDEIREMIHVCQTEIRQTLSKDNFHFLLGTMVETVSLVHQLSSLRNVDYLVIGSNDLLSDLMNINRNDTDFNLDLFLKPVFLDLVESIAKAAETLKLPVYLCGEAANHPEIVGELMKRKIVNFCPSPNRIKPE